jgi:hypothetical protein
VSGAVPQLTTSRQLIHARRHLDTLCSWQNASIGRGREPIRAA